MATRTNTVTYNIPTGGDAIGTSGVVATGSFTVAYSYEDDGKFKSASIVSSNITTSGGAGSNSVYNNIFNENSKNKFDALGEKTSGNGDHIGASVAFNSNTGEVNLK